MKVRTSVFAALLLTATAALSSVSHDSSNTLTASIDPPTGSSHCGFAVSGTIRSPKPDALTYTFVWQSELGVITLLNRTKAENAAIFKGPSAMRVTAQSREFGHDDVLRQHKFIKVQLRVYAPYAWVGALSGAVPTQPAMAESVWIDVPVIAPGCDTTIKLAPVLSPAAPASTSAPSHK
jgi:hypothetical protein